MKIIIATPLFPPEIESIATYSRDLAEHLKNKHQVQILAYAGQVEAIPGVTIYTIDKKQPLFFRIFNYFIKLNKLARSADYILAVNAVASGLPAILVKIFTKKPVIINFFEDEAWKRSRHLHLTNKSWADFLLSPETDGRIKRIMKLQAWVLRRADKIIVSSQSLVKALAKAYRLPAEKIFVNYLAPTTELQIPFPQQLVKHQLLASSPLTDWSGLREVIGAVGILKNKFTDIRLFIIGDGPEKNSLQKLVKELSLEKQIVFKGRVSKAEQAYLLNTSQLVIDNCQAESFSGFLPDCVAAQKSVAVAPRDYAQEILGDSGVYFANNTPADIAEKISAVLKKSAVIKETDVRFSWPKHLDKLETIFSR